MDTEKARTERFDDAFKLLLVIMTLSLSIGIGFFKDMLEFRALAYTIGFFIFTIAFWIFAHLRGGKEEYSAKIVAWWSMMMGFGILVARLIFSVFLLQPLVVSCFTIPSLFLTLPIIYYLRNNLGSVTPKNYSITLSCVTIGIVLIDFLYFFGVLSFS